MSGLESYVRTLFKSMQRSTDPCSLIFLILYRIHVENTPSLFPLLIWPYHELKNFLPVVALRGGPPRPPSPKSATVALLQTVQHEL